MTALARIGRGIRDLETFFGCALGEVNTTVALIIMHERKPWPEWLRSRSKMEDLPRWSAEAECRELHQFPLPLITPRERAERVRWIIETCAGPWGLNDRAFYFGSHYDAVAYRMRWSR
jgi:hypothetical protein